MPKTADLNEVLELAEQLSPTDQLRLIERLAPQIARSLNPRAPRGTLRGILKGIDISDEDIDEARKEMWKGFPRDDF